MLIKILGLVLGLVLSLVLSLTILKVSSTGRVVAKNFTDQNVVNDQVSEKIKTAEKATADLQKSTQNAFDKVGPALTELEKRTGEIEKQSMDAAKKHAEFAEETAKTLTEFNTRVGVIETQASKDRKAVVAVSKKATVATAAIAKLGKEMEAWKSAQVTTQTAVATATSSPVPTPVPATSVVTASQPAPVAVSVTAVASAISREKIDRETLVVGATSKRYTSAEVRAGKVKVSKRYGIVTVNNHIPGTRHQAEQTLPVQIPLTQGVTTYNDADWVTFTSDSPMEIELRM